jgi:hypothetical protein
MRCDKVTLPSTFVWSDPRTGRSAPPFLLASQSQTFFLSREITPFRARSRSFPQPPSRRTAHGRPVQPSPGTSSHVSSWRIPVGSSRCLAFCLGEWKTKCNRWGNKLSVTASFFLSYEKKGRFHVSRVSSGSRPRNSFALLLCHTGLTHL